MSRRRHRAARQAQAAKLAATAALLVMLAPPTAAQATSGGPEIQVNTTTAGYQIEPTIAPDSAGGFVVAWASYEQDGSGGGVYARHLPAVGDPSGEVPINTTTGAQQIEPAIAPDGSGGFTVAWQSEGQDGSGWGVYARRFDAAGAPLGGEIPVNSTTASSQVGPAIAPDPGGGFTIAWTSEAQDGSGGGVYARRFDSTGTPLSGEIPVNTTTASSQVEPAIAPDGTGGFTVTWASYGQDGSGYGVYARRFSGDPLSGGPEVLVNVTTTTDQIEPAIAADGGGFTVSWTNVEEAFIEEEFCEEEEYIGYCPGYTVYLRDIYARRLGADGTPLGGETTVGSGLMSAIAPGPGGGFTVAGISGIPSYRDQARISGTFGPSGYGYDLFARRFDSAGTPLSDAIPVNVVRGNQIEPAIASDGSGAFTIAWATYGPDGSEYGVLARRFVEAPETSIDSGPLGAPNAACQCDLRAISDVTPTFTFSSSEPGSTFECQLDDGGFENCSSPFTPTNPLADGPHTFEVRAMDAAAHTDPWPASHSFTVDTVAPDTSITSGPAGLTSQVTPSFTFSSSEGGPFFECRLDSSDEAAFQPCSSYLTLYIGTGSGPVDPLPDGPHTLEVRAIDMAHNTDPSPASRSFTVDSAAPETSIISGPAGLTNDPTPTFAFSSEDGAGFQCRLDGGSYFACSSPFTTSWLTDGPHVFEVRAIDLATNPDPDPAFHIFAVDAVAPNTWIDSGPAGPTNVATPTFKFSSEPGTHFECSLDSGSYSPCSSPLTTSPLSDGEHSFEVRATDEAANTDRSPAIDSFAIDTVAPETSIDSGPSDLSRKSFPVFRFSSNEQGANFECRLENEGYSPCRSPLTSGPLETGEHSFEVRATDAAANTDPSPAVRSFDTLGAAALPAPIRGETVIVEPVTGVVRIRERGSRRFQRLRAGKQIRLGSLVDVTRGRVSLTSAIRAGITQTADFYLGGFRVGQRASGKPTTELELVNLSRSGRRGHRRSGSGSGLWGNGQGSFSTKGKYGSATVRGTIWFTEDLPEGTFFKVERGIVQVEDFTRHRRLLLHPGQHYLAPAR